MLEQAANHTLPHGCISPVAASARYRNVIAIGTGMGGGLAGRRWNVGVQRRGVGVAFVGRSPLVPEGRQRLGTWREHCGTEPSSSRHGAGGPAFGAVARTTHFRENNAYGSNGPLGMYTGYEVKCR